MQLSDYKVGIAIFFVLLALLAILNPSPPVLETSKQKTPEGKNYSIDGQAVAVKKTFTPTGDVVVYENQGTQGVEFGVIDVIPPSVAENSQEVFFANSERAEAKTTFFDNSEPPVLRHTAITLGPGQSFERKTESKKFTLFPIAKKPIHVFSPKGLSEEEKKTLEPVLRKASSLLERMEDDEREVFEEKLNEAMLKARQNENTVEETAKGLGEFLDEVKKAKDEASATPTPATIVSPSGSPTPPPQSFLDRLKQTQANITRQSQQTDITGFEFPQLPQSVILEISEDEPTDVLEFTAESKVDLGSALVRVEGDGKDYLQVTTRQTTPTQYSFEINADFASRDTDEYGFFDFDESQNKLFVFFSRLQAESKSIPIVVKVNHVETTPEEKRDYERQVSLEEFNSVSSELEPVSNPENKKTTSKCQEQAQKVIKEAQRYLNLPYVWGGESITRGVDCSGLTLKAYQKIGIPLAHLATLQATKGVAVNRKDIVPGDLLFLRVNPNRKRYSWQTMSHVMLYVGNAIPNAPYGECTMIHASSSKGKVVYGNICRNGIKNGFAVARRIIPECIKSA
ncbi:MAG: C40 family peptidase [Candidatus Norongarragalinales archaeon]